MRYGSEMPPKPGNPWLLLLITGLAVVASFLGATVHTQHSLASIDAASDAIANNSAPSIRHLAALQREVRHIELLLDNYVDSHADDAPVSRKELDHALRLVEAEARAYLSFPTFPGEQQLWEALDQALKEFFAASGAAIAQVEQGDTTGARATIAGQLEEAADRSVAAASSAIEFNGQVGTDLALEIQRIRRRATLVGYTYSLSFVSAVLVTLAALRIRRDFRRYTGLLETHARFLQQRGDELESFAGRVAHDILSPLQSVQIAMHMAVRRLENDAQVEPQLRRGKRSLEQVTAVVHGLLEFARAGARSEPGAWAAATEVVPEVLAELRREADEAGVELVLEAMPAVEVACSAGVLTSLVSNLVRNAIKYMGDRPVRRVYVRGIDLGQKIRIEVQDTGPGIAPEDLDSIFEPYTRSTSSAQPGLGLGLATVKRLAEGHGGGVGVRCAPERGCTFCVELPRATHAPGDASEGGEPA